MTDLLASTTATLPQVQPGPASVDYRLHGVGPRRIIVLHGLFADGAGFAPFLVGFDPEETTFAVVDARGFGRSKSRPGPFDLPTFARDALNVADCLGWSDFAVMGHSMGGKAALRLALAAADRVKAVIGLAPIWAAQVPFDEAALARFRASVTDAEARVAIIAGSTGGRLPAYWTRGIALASREVSSTEAYAGYLSSFVSEDFAEEATGLHQPTLVIVGRNDAATSRMAKLGWSRLPRSEIVEFEACGHYPHIEAPLVTAATISCFLSEAGL